MMTRTEAVADCDNSASERQPEQCSAESDEPDPFAFLSLHFQVIFSLEQDENPRDQEAGHNLCNSFIWGKVVQRVQR